jgi:A/G-specific adenine glycosylase
MNNTPKEIIENLNIDQFQSDLIGWFEQEKRDLPWRHDKDPYKVWISEIMLQQTRVDTVIPYFNNFIAQFPTIDSLAEADEEKVLKAWEGLGYYSRARNLQAGVREVQESYNGIVPNTAEEISKLKGVGPYTTGAILSIAYGVPEPAVDGNVMRVMSRILSIWDDIGKTKTRQQFEGIIREIISKENPSYFNQGLMELGALICVPANPACLLCPVQKHCKAFEEGVQRELPVKSKKKQPKSVAMAAVVIEDDKGNVIIHKRPSKGLLANLWEFPNHETVSEFDIQKQHLKDYLLETYRLTVDINEQFTSIQHVFSHLIWNIAVYRGKLVNHIEELENLKLVSQEEIAAYPFPVSHQKIYKEYRKM